ncbi:hypothetical protein BKA01_003389 [Pseudonocardia eucalypti]|nr:hypothetical protein [Pseudonocardia eucalypti]
MTGLLIMVALAVLLAAWGPLFGVDSRDGRDWYNRPAREVLPRPGRGVRERLARCWSWLAGAWDRQERAWGECWRVHQPWRGDDLPPDWDELHWRVVRGEYRLAGRLMPPPTPPADRSGDPANH